MLSKPSPAGGCRRRRRAATALLHADHAHVSDQPRRLRVTRPRRRPRR